MMMMIKTERSRNLNALIPVLLQNRETDFSHDGVMELKKDGYLQSEVV